MVMNVNRPEGIGGGAARSSAGIEGAGGRNVSKVNKNGSAAPATKKATKKLSIEDKIAADLNAFLNFNAGR